MEGIRSGQRRILTVERDYEVARMAGKLLAAAYEEVLPMPRRRVLVARPDGEREMLKGPARRALVGA